MTIGYDGLPPAYIGKGSPLTPNLGLSVFGMDPVLSENMFLIDTFAAGPFGSSIDVNGFPVTNPNFNDTIPAAVLGFRNIVWSVSGSNVSASIDTSGLAATPAGNDFNVQFNRAGAFGGSDNFDWDYFNNTLNLTSNTTAESVLVSSGDAPPLSNLAGIFVHVQMDPTIPISLSETDVAILETQIDTGNGGTSTVTDAAGAKVSLFVGSVGAIINYRGVWIPSPQIQAGGTIVHSYGIYIEDQTSSGADPWAIYVVAGKTHLGGALDVTGTIASTTTINAATGYKQGGAAPSGHYLRGNGTNYVDGTIQSGDLPAGTGTVTSVAFTTGSGASDALYTITGSPITTSGTITETLKTQTANTVFSGPTSGGALAPTFRALVAADLPAGTGTVTSFSAGTLSPLFTTSVATATTTPALSFTLTNAPGGTVFGNNTTGSAAPAYTISPVLGIPGTSTGTIALASSTASGKFTITAPASAATPTLTLPTTSNVLAGQIAGDGTIFSSSLVVASAAGTLTLPTPQNQTANTIFSGPTSGGAAAPTFRALVTADIPSGTVLWNQIGNPNGNLTLSMAGNTTTFNQTSAVNWIWANTTAATSGTSQSSPIHNINGTYWNGAASATDSWTMQDVVANGTNGNSIFTLGHTGSTGLSALELNLSTNCPIFIGVNTSTTVNGFMWMGQSSPTTSNYVLNASGPGGSQVTNLNAVVTTNLGINGNMRVSLTDTALQLIVPITKYNNISTVSNGIPAEYATVDLTAQSAAIGATTIYTPVSTGMFRISWTATITTAGTTSVLGGANGFQTIYTSPTDSVVKTTVVGDSVPTAANTTGTATGGCEVIYAKAATAIQYSFGYTSTGTAMVYEIHVKVEAL